MLKNPFLVFLSAMGQIRRARSSVRIEHRAFKQNPQRNPGVPGSIPGGPATHRVHLSCCFLDFFPFFLFAPSRGERYAYMKETMTSEVEKNKLYVEQPTSEPKVKAFISAYEPLRIENCEKCGK